MPLSDKQHYINTKQRVKYYFIRSLTESDILPGAAVQNVAALRIILIP